MKDFESQKAAILNDKRLTAAAKRSDLLKLHDEQLSDLASERETIAVRQQNIVKKLDELKKSKYQRPLPEVKIDDKKDIEEALAGLVGNMVALMAEERAGKRLLTKLSMSNDANQFLQTIDSATWDNPAAVISEWSAIMKYSNYRFAGIPGITAQINELYAKALENEKTPEERKWEDKNAFAVNDLGKSKIASFQETLHLATQEEQVRRNIREIQADDFFFGGESELTPLQKAEKVYFGANS